MSTIRPRPVAWRSCSADRMPIEPNMPPVKSPSGTPSLTGAAPTAPFTLNMPLIAWVTMSNEGLSLSGPESPKPLTAQ